MKKAVFYHAGCPVCVSAEQDLLNIIDHTKYNVEVVHLGEKRDKLHDAERAGIKSVPALVLEGGNVLHINYGASLADVKK
jgi:glutaredoxin 3